MDERQKKVNEDMSRFDGDFAEIALAKGYATQTDLAAVHGQRTRTGGEGGPFPMTLPQAAIEHKLMNYDQVDEVLSEMFDSPVPTSRSSEFRTDRSVAGSAMASGRLAG